MSRNEFGLIGSPIYSSFHVVEFELCKIRGLIQRCDAADSGARVFHSGYLRAQRHFNRSKPFLYPLEPNQDSGWLAIRFPPGPHFRDYWLRGRFRVLVSLNGGGCQIVPSRNMAQQRTNNRRPTATIAIFLRDFLPPLIR